MKKGPMILLTLLAAIGCGGAGFYKCVYEPACGSVFASTVSGGKSAGVAMDQVATLTNAPDADGLVQCYAGIVEAQEEWAARADSERKIAQTYVKAGDMIEAGADLFSYDTAEDLKKIEECKLELEKKANENEASEKVIAQYRKQENAAESDEERLEAQTNILEENNKIRENVFEAKAKEKEIEQLQEAVRNATVKSEIAGIVKAVGKTSSGVSGSEEDAYITVMAVGDLRVKGYANEQNIDQLEEGMQVAVLSRTHPGEYWTGTVDTIKREGERAAGDASYDEESDPMSSSSRYPFYVTLEDTDGLMIGQHIYIEEDRGQRDRRDGLWISAYYIRDAEGEPFVWTESPEGKTEKRSIRLGDYDEGLGKYEILSGLSELDYIAVPDQEITEGMKASHTLYA